MPRSVLRLKLVSAIAAAMLLSTTAYADKLNTTMFENAPTLSSVNVTANVSNSATDLPPVTVTANVGSDGYVSSQMSKQITMPFVDRHSRIYSSPDKTTTDCNGGSGAGDSTSRPIAISNGAKYEEYPLFSIPGEMGLRFGFHYYQGSFETDFDYSIDLACSDSDPSVCRYVKFYRPDGSTLTFNGRPDAGPFTEQGGGGLATLSYDPASATYTVHDEDAKTLTFVENTSGIYQGLTSIKDPSGIGWTFSYATINGNYTTTITHTGGRSFTITNVVGQSASTHNITDPAGNVYVVQYGLQLNSISYPGTPATTITFVHPGNGPKITEVDYNGVPYDYTSYVSDSTSPFYGRAAADTLGDGSEATQISYSRDASGILHAVITNPLGHQTTNDYAGTNGSGGAYNGLLSLISDTAVSTCAATTHGRSYDANGNLSEEIDNNGIAHTYTYAANGQLQTETEAYGTPQARTTDYVWDPSQQLNRLLSVTVEGWRKTSYTYNAQNRLASISVTNLSSSGVANQTLTTSYGYTLYGNGMVQSATVTKPSPNGSDVSTSQYDSYGDLTSVTNGLGQTTSYSNYNGLGEVGHVVGPNGDATDFTYDARGRVASKTTYPNGTAATWTYAYDGFGLPYTSTAPDGQVTTWIRDPSTMRVVHITHNDKDGTSTENFNYDANGDVIEHEIVRGGVVAQDEMYHYDALGRLYQKVGNSGQTLTYAYDGNGNTLSVMDAVGHSVVNQYDALNRVTQTTESGGASPAMPATAPTINVPATNANGTYTVSWNSITGATFYVLQEKVGSGGWANVQSNSAVTWTPTNKTTNTYSYQVKACNATGCSPFSAVGTITVSIPTAPTSAPSLTVPGSSNNGNYTVSWTAVATAGTYNLQEQVNGGSWSTIQAGTLLSWSVNGKPNGTYAYRSQACNGVGCGPWSNTGTMVVSWPPIPGVPSISVPARNYTGSYTVSWNGVANAASYPLYQSSNGGASWTLVQNNAATSWTASNGTGTYNYAVSACDISGCGGQTGGATIVIIPAPLAFNGSNYWATNTVNPSGNEGIGFDIANGNTWEVFSTKPGNAHVVNSSGAVPWGAATVQFTWTDAGVPAGFTNALGSIVYNNASSPTPIGNNPATIYTTNSFNRNGDHAHTYSFRVDFFDAAGVNISSSTCTLTAEVTGNL